MARVCELTTGINVILALLHNWLTLNMSVLIAVTYLFSLSDIESVLIDNFNF